MKRIYFKWITVISIPLSIVFFTIYSFLATLAGIDMTKVYPYNSYKQFLGAIILGIIIIPLVWANSDKFNE